MSPGGRLPAQLPPPPPPPPRPPLPPFGGSGSHDLIAWLFVLSVVVLVGVVVYFAVRYASRPLPGAPVLAPPPSGDPLLVVSRRYANGEISREEFLRMTADLAPAAEPPPRE
jgi:hypothetical protein